MAKEKTRIRYFEVNAESGGFVSKILGSKESVDFSDLKLLRQVLSKEKGRIIYFLKEKKPKSIYSLAKMLGRDFKSVREDVLMLERFGFIEFHAEKKGNRESLMPVLIVDKMIFELKI